MPVLRPFFATETPDLNQLGKFYCAVSQKRYTLSRVITWYEMVESSMTNEKLLIETVNITSDIGLIRYRRC